MGTRCIITLILGCTGWAYAQSTFIEVDAGAYVRKATVVEAQLLNPLLKGVEYKIRNVDTGSSSPVQSLAERTILFILPDSLAAGKRATYKLEKTKSSPTNNVKLIKQEGGILFQSGQKKVLYYSTKQVDPPHDNPAYYARSGFIHPLYSPSGAILTDDFPVGHVHQHGIMMAWVSTKFKNATPDFWNQQLRKGNVRHVNVLSVEEGPVFCRARLQLQHYIPPTEEVLKETWTVTVYSFNDYFLYDIRSDQINTTNDTLFLNKYHYGGMAFRGSRQWNSDDTVHYQNAWNVMTDSGYHIIDGNGKHAAYVSVEGKIDKQVSGVTVFGFPNNFRYPQSIRIHPTMPYWCYAPVVDGPFLLLPGQIYSSRYRYYVHDNRVDIKKVKQLYHEIIDPPVVRVFTK